MSASSSSSFSLPTSSIPTPAVSASITMRVPTGVGCTPSDVMMALNKLSSTLLSPHGIQLPQISRIVNPQLRSTIRTKCLKFGVILIS
jgi:hypothetical protein